MPKRSKHLPAYPGHSLTQSCPRSELVDRLLYAMALIGDQRRTNGNTEANFDLDEIFQKMILEHLFKTEDGVTLQEIITLAIERKLVSKVASSKWLCLST